MNTESLASWRFMQIDLAGIAVLAVGAGLLYWIGVMPIYSIRGNLAAQEAALAQQHQSVAALAIRADGVKQQLAAVRETLGKSAIALDNAAAVNRRIGRLTELAVGLNLRVDEIQPGEPIYGTHYGAVPIHLTGRGGYRDWAAFARKLSADFPDVSVDSFQLSAKPDTPSSPVEFAVDLVWFVRPPPKAIAQR
jgi:Tfp pilus assembly protein PilO